MDEKHHPMMDELAAMLDGAAATAEVAETPEEARPGCFGILYDPGHESCKPCEHIKACEAELNKTSAGLETDVEVEKMLALESAIADADEIAMLASVSSVIDATEKAADVTVEPSEASTDADASTEAETAEKSALPAPDLEKAAITAPKKRTRKTSGTSGPAPAKRKTGAAEHEGPIGAEHADKLAPFMVLKKHPEVDMVAIAQVVLAKKPTRTDELAKLMREEIAKYSTEAMYNSGYGVTRRTLDVLADMKVIERDQKIITWVK